MDGPDPSDAKDPAEVRVPISDWIPERPFDHAEYLARAAISIDDLPPTQPERQVV